MIPRAHITAWRSQAPWPTDAQIEQDLVLTRALTEIFKQSAIANAVALLPTEVTYQAKTAYEMVSSRLIALLPGNPWKGAAS
jgi:hypothetical protein